MKRANVLQQDSHQIIKLPRSLRINSQQVFIKQVGNALVLIPSENPWQSLFDSLGNFSDDFMEIREQPELQVRENLFE
jgi:antitoxin VapB